MTATAIRVAWSTLLASMLALGSATAAGATVVVRPATGLVDGQTIAVDLTAMPAFDVMIVTQCNAERTRCNLDTFQVVVADETGWGTTSLAATSTVNLTDCVLLPGACVVAVYSAATGWTTVPLAFASVSSPEITVDTRATISPKTKAITVTGTVDCHGVHAAAVVDARQDSPAAAASAEVPMCDGEFGNRPWSVTVPGPKPPFVPGHLASVTISLESEAAPAPAMATASAAASVSYSH